MPVLVFNENESRMLMKSYIRPVQEYPQTRECVDKSAICILPRNRHWESLLCKWSRILQLYIVFRSWEFARPMAFRHLCFGRQFAGKIDQWTCTSRSEDSMRTADCVAGINVLMSKTDSDSGDKNVVS